MTGENVLVTVEIGDNRVAAKADRLSRNAIGDRVGLKVDPARIYLFEASTGERIRTC